MHPTPNFRYTTSPSPRWAIEALPLRVVRTDYCLVFPKVLSALRRCEQYLMRLPIGAQYQVLCQKGVDESAARRHQ
jgi:hypothetical protein